MEFSCISSRSFIKITTTLSSKKIVVKDRRNIAWFHGKQRHMRRKEPTRAAEVIPGTHGMMGEKSTDPEV
jgi:hypothetical protein